jgi:DNA repair protein RecN (Recombination protein N)
MLELVHISNLAIIEDLTVEFAPGFNVLTGETGAGKSILIGAIQLLLGAKASMDLIRQGADEAQVEALFRVEDAKTREEMLKRGIQPHQEELILRRVVLRSGKGKAYVNGQLSPISLMAHFGRCQVNIYGQHEHQDLLQPERHLDLLDEHGRLMGLRRSWEEKWKEFVELRSLLAKAEASAEEMQMKRELWEFQLKEIADARLSPGEEEALDEEMRILANSQRIREILMRCEDSLYGERGSALERLQMALREMREASRFASFMGEIAESLEVIKVQLEETLRNVRSHCKEINWDPQRLLAIEERLETIRRLKRKYRLDVPGLLGLAEELQTRLLQWESAQEALEKIRERLRAKEEELVLAGENLRSERMKAGALLARGVERELRDLGVEHPRLEVSVKPLQEGIPLAEGKWLADPRGMDQVEFLLSMNLGEEPRPLWRIASGGELSRIMLAMKKVLADADRVPTLIFDEIDSGIGGGVARALGEKLAHIARSHQVLCVTHLPQVACFADHHLRVSKRVKGGRTVTVVEPLDMDERIEELSRMLGGKGTSSKAREHAKELLERARGEGWAS